MAKYRITAPDGGTYEVTAPDGASEADVLAYAQANYQGAPAQKAPDFSNFTGGSTTRPNGQAEPPRGNPVTRALGEIGGRQVLQGAAGLYGALGGDALNHYVLDPLDRALFPAEQSLSGLVTGQQPQQRSVLGTGGRTYREAAADLADNLGMRAPQTSGERVMSDVGEALTGTGLTLGIGGGINALSNLAGRAAPAASRIGNFLTAQPRLQAVSTATGAGAASTSRESGGSQGQQLAAGLIGGLAPGVAGATTTAGVRGLVRGRDGSQMQRNIDDFGALGATPSVGQASGRGWVKGLEGLLSRGPTSLGVVGRFAEQQADDIGRGLQTKAAGLSPEPGSGSAGLAIERGMESFKGDTAAVKRALYWAVDQHIPSNTRTPIAHTQRALTRLTTPDPGAPATTGAMVQPRISQLRQNIAIDIQANGGSLSYEALKRIRSDIGEAIGRSSPLNPDSDLRELNALYSALSEDMLEAAKAHGPQAVKAAQRANKYTRDVANRMELVRRVLDKNGGPEKVFQAAMAGTNDGATTLRGVMLSLPKEEQKAVSAAVIKRMGLPTPGQAGLGDAEFSASTFVTNWNKLSPESKKVLFGRYGASFKESMDRVASVANNIKRGSKVYANPSGSAVTGAGIAYWSGLPLSMAQAPVTGHYWPVAVTVLGGLSANVVARAMTSPRAVNWLAMSTDMPVGSINASLRQMASEAQRAGDDAAVEFAAELAEQQPEGAPGQRPQGQNN